MHPPETFPWLPSERQPRMPLLPVLPYSVQGSLPPSAATTGRDNGTRSAEVRPMAEPPACKPAASGRREVEALGEEAATGMGGGTAVASCALMPPKRVDYWQSSPGRWIVARRLSAKPTARVATGVHGKSEANSRVMRSCGGTGMRPFVTGGRGVEWRKQGNGIREDTASGTFAVGAGGARGFPFPPPPVRSRRRGAGPAAAGRPAGPGAGR